MKKAKEFIWKILNYKFPIRNFYLTILLIILIIIAIVH